MRGLRSILRHDPDKIMVGEIRDAETAQIAIQAALTGHLVFTTVHANNVFDVIGRFAHMGVDPYSFVSALNGIVAQRLVRLLCENCRIAEQPEWQTIEEAGISQEQAAHYAFHTAKGCGQCRGSGYRGRSAIAEILLLNDGARINCGASADSSYQGSCAFAWHAFLREAALELVKSGHTSLQEANRVTVVA